MTEVIEKLELERERSMTEAKKYSAGDWRKTYYIGYALGIGQALGKLRRESNNSFDELKGGAAYV